MKNKRNIVVVDEAMKQELVANAENELKRLNTIIIQLTDQLTEVRLKYNRYTNFLQQLIEGKDLLKPMNSFVITATSGVSMVNEPEIDYSSEWTWPEKISFVCKEANKPVKTEEIIDRISAYEQNTRNKEKLTIHLRPLISELIKNQVLYKFRKSGDKANYLLHKCWFDKEGTLLEEYRERFEMYQFET